MADSKVRFVRCPKCENVLPELPDYSVYQCGGCGTVLRAELRNSEVDALPDKYDGDTVGGVMEELSKFPGEGLVHPSVASEANIRSTDSCSFKCDQRCSEYDNVPYNAEKTKFKVDKWVVKNDLGMNMNRDELSSADKVAAAVELKSRVENASGSRKSGAISDRQIQDRVGIEQFQKTLRTDVENLRFTNRPNEGSSNSHSCSEYIHREQLKNGGSRDASNRVECLKEDRAKLLRKLDELKDQLGQSCNVVEKQKEEVPQDRRMLYQESCFSQYPVPHPSINRTPDMAPHAFYPSMHTSNHIPVYGDPYRSHVLKQAPPQVPCHYQQQPSHLYVPKRYMDAGLDPYVPFPHNAVLHQSSCSCFHCHAEHQSAPPTAIPIKRFPYVPNNPMLYEKPGAFGPRIDNPGSLNPPLNSLNPHLTCSNGINPDMGRFHPRTVVVANAARHCHPMAGGAPFITCRKCFELLQLPKKGLRKVQCGACSAIIILATVDKKIVITAQEDTGVVNPNSNSPGIVYSDDSGYEFHSIDREPISMSTVQCFDSNKSQDTQSIDSSLSTSGDEDFPDGLIDPREKAISSPPLPGSPLQEHFDYSSNNHAVNRCGKGNRSTRSDQEKAIPNKTTSRQNSMKDVPLASEMDDSFNEDSNAGVSQGSAGISREEQSRINKGSDSFFAGIIKKSFRDFTRANQTTERGKINVTVNGQPIPDRVVKRAEKLAGSIHPGQYWYDSRAGFWGVMGGPCLGIIPPFIEEFNHSMPENCAGGSTGVFVNGRELHVKDLELLASRGLPTERNRSYIIEISGRVLDEDSGTELDSLGKLAPTVEKVRHGFGMKAPRAAS